MALASASATAGFNPCFSGFTSTRIPDYMSLERHATRFQSLFFWIHFHKARYARWRDRKTSTPVSILVFLDSLPQETSIATSTAAHTLTTICFNPCFSGFTSTSGPVHCLPILMPVRALFQSLFFWIHFHKRSDQVSLRGDYRRVVFQSLFFWIHFHKPLALTAASTKSGNTVSILVFLDSLPQVSWSDVRSGQLIARRFQSLFFWIHFHKTRVSSSSRALA